MLAQHGARGRHQASRHREALEAVTQFFEEDFALTPPVPAVELDDA